MPILQDRYYKMVALYPNEERLIHPLKHTISEYRVSLIIALANLKSRKAAIPLAECALYS